MNRFYNLIISILINALITLMICTIFMCKILQIKYYVYYLKYLSII